MTERIAPNRKRHRPPKRPHRRRNAKGKVIRPRSPPKTLAALADRLAQLSGLTAEDHGSWWSVGPFLLTVLRGRKAPSVYYWSDNVRAIPITWTGAYKLANAYAQVERTRRTLNTS